MCTVQLADLPKSMRTRCSKPSPLKMAQHCTTVSQRWRHYTSHGRPVSISQSMPSSALPSVLGWTRLTNTIKRPLTRTSTLSPCVRVTYGRCSNANNPCLLVLDPSQKARHLDKFWGKELCQEAVDRAEKIVRFSSF